MKKNKKIVICLFIILLIILISILIAINIIKDKGHGDYEVMGVDFSETINSLSISNLSVLGEFIGTENNKDVKIAKKYRDFFTIEIPKLKKEMQNYQDISEYYKLEIKTLQLYYFEIDEESFINLCKKINLMNSNLETEYDNCSFSLNEAEDALIVTCTYQNGEEIILEMTSDQKISLK